MRGGDAAGDFANLEMQKDDGEERRRTGRRAGYAEWQSARHAIAAPNPAAAQPTSQRPHVRYAA